MRHPLPPTAAARRKAGLGTSSLQTQTRTAPEDSFAPNTSVDVPATTAVEVGTVRPLNHTAKVALGFLVATLAEILVGGIRVKRIKHFLLVQSLVAADTGETSIPRDLHRPGQVLRRSS